MVITVTSIKLRSLWHFFRLSYFGLRISRQARSQKGFIEMKNTGFGYLHYTISAWENEAEMKEFARSGAHREAMRAGGEISVEIRTYTFEGPAMPTWKEARKLLFEKGKIVSFE